MQRARSSAMGRAMGRTYRRGKMLLGAACGPNAGGNLGPRTPLARTRLSQARPASLTPGVAGPRVVALVAPVATYESIASSKFHARMSSTGGPFFKSLLKNKNNKARAIQNTFYLFCTDSKNQTSPPTLVFF